MSLSQLKRRIRAGETSALPDLAAAGRATESFTEYFTQARLGALARRGGLEPEPRAGPIRLALIGAGTMSPLRDLVFHAHWVEGLQPTLFVGDFDSYPAEILSPDSELYRFAPTHVVVIPSPTRARYPGSLLDDSTQVRAAATRAAEDLQELISVLRERCACSVLLANFVVPFDDLGPIRTSSLAAPSSFTQLVNLELGLAVASQAQICDVERAARRLGQERSVDERRWIESKQLFGVDLQVAVAKEIAHWARRSSQRPKKVLVLDLDNTLWGGVIGDDGLSGIVVDENTPRGQAYRALQSYAKSLKERGFLLAVCSKNDQENAIEPFEALPDMVLEPSDFVAFKANWHPKPENIQEIADELGLGVDSFVFLDDNPAEIAIVEEFLPQVVCVQADPDPLVSLARLRATRLFEVSAITAEDSNRTGLYQQESERKQARGRFVDLEAFLASLEMKALVRPFDDPDRRRITQLINRSNQFNLTTVRRTEAEVEALTRDPQHRCFTIRLNDRFGENGVVVVVIGRVDGVELVIDTWLMSCRVLKRQVEEVTVNEMVRIARASGLSAIRGAWIRSKKNGMVAELYDRMGFERVHAAEDRREYRLTLAEWTDRPTSIRVER